MSALRKAAAASNRAEPTRARADEVIKETRSIEEGSSQLAYCIAYACMLQGK
jgi:hypothetical protein